MTGTTVDDREVDKFSALSERWWDPAGPFRPLHRMNPVRLDYVRDQICAEFGRDPTARRALDGLQVVDVGCGGGLLCEPLTRLGATVTGLDAAGDGIAAARAHADAMGLDIEYRDVEARVLTEEGKRFDVVLALEVVEHVSDVQAFLNDLSALVKPDGLVILSTLNRTPQSFALGVVAAEYLLRWLPRGTHDWRKFLTPEELGKAAAEAGLNVVDRSGFQYHLLRESWTRGDDLSINYAMTALPT